MNKHRFKIFTSVKRTVAISSVLLLSILSTEVLAGTKITVGRTTGASGFHIPSYVAME